MADTPASPLRRRLLLAGAAVLPAGCALVGPQREQLAAPAVPPAVAPVLPGQQWHYATIDGYRNVQRGELHARVLSPAEVAATSMLASAAPLVVALTGERGQPKGEEHWTKPWQILVDPSYDLAQVFESPMPYLPDVLAPGARRNDATWYTTPGSSFRNYWRQNLRATGWERVDVPAGSFDALRVERYINFQHADGWRQFPWRTDVLWYSPLVGRWVRREWTGRYLWPGRRRTEAEEDRVAWVLTGWDVPGGRVG